MIRTANENETSQMKKLWKNGFNDSDEFIEFYFGTRYNSRYNSIYIQNGNIEASAQVVPFQMIYNKNKLNSSYILGVVTHSEHRKKGRAGELMKYILKDQYSKGVMATNLIPQDSYLFEFYRKFGFEETFKINKVVYNLNTIKNNNTMLINHYNNKNMLPEMMIDIFYEFYDDMYKQNFCTLLKSKDDFIFTINEFLLFEGDIFITLVSNKITGCIFLDRTDNNYRIKEFLFRNNKERDALLEKLYGFAEQNEIVAFLPQNSDTNESLHPLGMTRIVNVKDFLTSISVTIKDRITLNISDSIVDENNGIYRIEDGLVKKLSTIINCNYNFNINELAKCLFNKNSIVTRNFSTKNLNGYINLMLN